MEKRIITISRDLAAAAEPSANWWQSIWASGAMTPN